MKRLAIAYAVPLMCLTMGFPLALGAVPPNAGYGYRTFATLQSDELWYAVNRELGLALVAAGSVGVALSRLLLRTTQSWAVDLRVAICASAGVLLFLGALRVFLLRVAL